MLIEKNYCATDINAVRRAAVAKTLKESVGKRILILTAEFPFLIIGKIKKVEGDYVYVYIETTNVDEFEERTIRIHVDRIVVFHIESTKYPIPKIGKESYFNERGEEK